MTDKLPPAQEQFDILCRGTVDLHPQDAFLERLQKSHKEQKPLIIKLGCDPTAPDLHLGHTVVIEKMAQFQSFGHEVVFLVGDYTALIGDPSGRNTLRPPLSPEAIAAHAATYTEQCFKILDRDKTRVVFNSEWLEKLSFRDLLSLTSKYNLGRMLERRDFKDRFESNRQIALHELLYPLMQGYDSVALKNDVELGGHDQIFNLNVGRHLMEAYGQQPQIVMTVGLLVGLDGVEKMSKSKGNTIGITEGPEDIFGKTMSISDDTMKTWLPLLLGKAYDDDQDPLAQKKHLGRALVDRFCGKAAGRRHPRMVERRAPAAQRGEQSLAQRDAAKVGAWRPAARAAARMPDGRSCRVAFPSMVSVASTRRRWCRWAAICFGWARTGLCSLTSPSASRLCPHPYSKVDRVTSGLGIRSGHGAQRKGRDGDVA